MISRVLATISTIALMTVDAGLASPVANGTGDAPETIREIFVPFEDLDVLLEGQLERVLLSRTEYEALRAKARAVPKEPHAPLAALPVSAAYTVTIGLERATLSGRIVLDVLEEGLQVVDLDLAGVGLRAAQLDGRAAAIGSTGPGQLKLFVEGAGRHELTLEMVAPVVTTAALQTLSFRVPTPAVTRLFLTVPGDVEVKAGADVVSRAFDETVQVTRFELLAKPGEVSLVMTLNNRLLQRRRVVISRSVLVAEVTESYERLHVSFSLAVLHRPVDRFRFLLPDDFKVTDVKAPELTRWAIEREGDRRILEVRLREQTTGTALITLSAVRTPSRLKDWTLPVIEPLDVTAQVSVLVVLLDQRLKLGSLRSQGLISIDTGVLSEAFPTTVFRNEPDAAPLRAVAAYYAPTGVVGGRTDEQPRAAVSAQFEKPPPRLLVTTNLLLLVGEKNLQARGGFALKPEVERVFSVDFLAPPGWHVLSVTDAAGESLLFEARLDTSNNGQVAGDEGKRRASRIHVRLPNGIAPGNERNIYFHALHTPAGWLSEWTERQVSFPVFTVQNSARDVGAIAIQAGEDMDVLPDTLQRLMPLDQGEKQKYGLHVARDSSPNSSYGTLAYRYSSSPYAATFKIERIPPRLRAHTYSFIRLEPGLLSAHFELVYDVEEARTKQLSFLLPESTPADIAIRAVAGAVVKEYEGAVVDGMRRWTVLLAEPRRDTIRLAVDFGQALDRAATDAPDGTNLAATGGSQTGAVGELDLPIVLAAGVVYQSGHVAVEADAELDVQITEHPRAVDVGELAGAQSRPDSFSTGALGVFAFVGAEPRVNVRVARHPGYALPATIVQRAELVTALSAEGLSQTALRLQLRTKAGFLEIELPPGSSLWSAELDGRPAKPQRQGTRLLLSLSAGASSSADTLRDVRMVYETPVEAVAFWDNIEIQAPKLVLRPGGSNGVGVEVPVADLRWHLFLPAGFLLTDQHGTVFTDEITRPEPAAWSLGRLLYRLAGGVDFLYGDWFPSLSRARELSPRALTRSLSSLKRIEQAEAIYRGPAMDGLFDADDRRPASQRGLADAARKQGLSKRPGKRGARQTKVIQSRAYWALAGVRSLKIDLEPAGETVTFRSLGIDPRLDVTLANERRVESLAWGLAFAVALVGLALTKRRVRAKTRYVVAVAAVATAVPLLPGMAELAYLTNPVFYAAALLVPYYLLARLATWLLGKLRRPLPLPAATVATIAFLLGSADTARAQSLETSVQNEEPMIVRIVEPPKPVDVPEDAILVPYDPKTHPGLAPPISPDDRMLVPYRKFVEWWDLAYPAERIEVAKPPATYALAGAAYSATLVDDEYLTVEGLVEIEIFTDDFVAVPLELDGGVLTTAQLDGAPARLAARLPKQDPLANAVRPPDQASGSGQAQARRPKSGSLDGEPATRADTLFLQIQGKGRHQLELTVRFRLTRRGGWRVVVGRLPTAPAAALSLRVPNAGTEVRVEHIRDRQHFETQSPTELIETALAADGAISVRWRPKVHEGRVDPSLTATSQTLLDVREDGLLSVWKIKLEFGRTDRDSLTFLLPGEYLVQKADGPNVRGWTARPEDGQQRLEVTLLKPARGSETITLVLHRQRVGAGAPGIQLVGRETAEFDVPVVRVPGALLHTGELTIRRSPLLRLRTMRVAGVTRMDTPKEVVQLAKLAGDGRESPLGVRPFQAYRFSGAPFTVRLAASRDARKPSVKVQTVLRIAERERRLESRVLIHAGDLSPVYRIGIVVPAELKIEHVSVPGAFEWTIINEAARKILHVYLATGQQRTFPILIRGALGEEEVVESVPLPGIEVLNAGSQRGDIVVQVDPAFDVHLADLKNCREVVLQDVYTWLAAEQRSLARLALRCSSPNYSGVVRLSPRRPEVTCSTISNVRITETSVEETVLLDFAVARAGIRTISFLLPGWMKDSRITVPMLREKTVEPVSENPDSPVRIRLVLQDDVMGRTRVLIENDRPLTGDTHRVPIPLVETGRTIRQYVALESAGRDEVAIETLAGLETLTRRQKEWRSLADVLGDGITQAYIVRSDEPLLAFKTRERVAVETVGARIGLAQTVLVLDPGGAYRAAQSYRVDNSTEQFLEIELPEGASLWSVLAAGTPVKPAKSPGAGRSRNVRIPLIKTAAGDLDYEVVVSYGGQSPEPGVLSSVSFPLIRTVNVSVELSQVQLFLPRQYHWFGFDGTMRQVVQEGDLEAGQVRYQTRVLDRLVETMEGGSPFARARAMANFQALKSQMGGIQDAAQIYTDNPALQEQVRSNVQSLRRGEEQLQQIVQPTEQQADRLSNRFLLNEAYDKQRATRARNRVQELDDNFVASVESQRDGKQQGGRSFSDDWLAANKLQQVPTPEQRRAAQQRVAKKGQQDPSVRLKRKRLEVQPQSPQVAQQAVKDEIAAVAGQGGGRRGLKRRRGGRGGTKELVSKYQQQLQQEVQPNAAYGDSEFSSDDGPRSMSFGVGREREAAETVIPTGSFGRAAVGSSGLTSLSVDFPARGVMYSFTTPRGEIEITARATSTTLVETLSRAATALIPLVVLVAIYALRRRGRLERVSGRTGSTVLIVFGFVGLVSGVLPVMALLVLGVGVAMKIRLRRLERSAATA